MLREFNIRGVAVGQQKLEEFEVGKHITFHDEYTGKTGSGIIYSFAMDGYKPLCWYYDDMTKNLKCVHLGWCTVDDADTSKNNTATDADSDKIRTDP